MSMERPGRKGVSATYERIYAVVNRVPRGRVATYGQIANLAGFPRQPRLIGYALHALPDARPVPWHRVINARGEISGRSEPGIDQVQKALLQREGVAFSAGGQVDLSRYQWRPRWPGWRAGTSMQGRTRPSPPGRVGREADRRDD